jgi:UDP-glucose 4-epimerase
MPGVEVYVTDKCVGCGACTRGVCFANAIHLENGRAVISDECRGCGLCVEACPEQAIKLEVNVEDSFQKTIERLSRIVDVS